MDASIRQTGFPILRPTSLRVNVADLLRTVLLQRRFAPGEELTDSALAAEFGVSRGPVREALIILAEEGLVEHRHYRGFRVPILRAEDLVRINEARQPLEILSLELARAQRPSGRAIRRLTELKEALLEVHARSSDDVSLTAYPDYLFHNEVWQLAGNPWLAAGLRRICSVRFLHVSARSLGFAAPNQQEMDAKHQQYIDFIAGKLQSSAEECVARHLKFYRKPSPRSGDPSGQKPNHSSLE